MIRTIIMARMILIIKIAWVIKTILMARMIRKIMMVMIIYKENHYGKNKNYNYYGKDDKND